MKHAMLCITAMLLKTKVDCSVW